MKSVGLWLMWAGFLAAVFSAVQQESQDPNKKQDDVNWMIFIPGSIVGVIGVVVMRSEKKGSAEGAEELTASGATLQQSLDALVDKITAKNQEDYDVYSIHGWVDDQLMEHIDDFVQARESMISLYGITTYADIMTSFATGERALNRAWSASADGYIDEVKACMARGEALMKEAQEGLRQAS